MTSSPSSPDPLEDRARRLGLYGLLAHWQELGDQPWVQTLIAHEVAERRRRSLERRIRTSKVGRFRSIADFDWSWPNKIDRLLIEELLQLDFIEEATNVILAGPNGVGKSTIAQNIAHLALLRGQPVLCATATRPILLRRAEGFYVGAENDVSELIHLQTLDEMAGRKVRVSHKSGRRKARFFKTSTLCPYSVWTLVP